MAKITLWVREKNPESIRDLTRMWGIENDVREPDKKESILFEVKHPTDGKPCNIGYTIKPNQIIIWREEKK